MPWLNDNYAELMNVEEIDWRRRRGGKEGRREMDDQEGMCNVDLRS